MTNVGDEGIDIGVSGLGGDEMAREEPEVLARSDHAIGAGTVTARIPDLSEPSTIGTRTRMPAGR